MSLSPHKVLILQGNTSKEFYEAHFAWISNERHSLLRQRTAILNGRGGWNQIKLETDLFLFLVNSDLRGESCIHYFILTKLTKKQKHTSCIEGQNSKNIISFCYSSCVSYSRFQLYPSFLDIPGTGIGLSVKGRESLRTTHSVDNLGLLNLSITGQFQTYTVRPYVGIFCDFIILFPSS